MVDQTFPGNVLPGGALQNVYVYVRCSRQLPNLVNSAKILKPNQNFPMINMLLPDLVAVVCNKMTPVAFYAFVVAIHDSLDRRHFGKIFSRIDARFQKLWNIIEGNRGAYFAHQLDKFQCCHSLPTAYRGSRAEKHYDRCLHLTEMLLLCRQLKYDASHHLPGHHVEPRLKGTTHDHPYDKSLYITTYVPGLISAAGIAEKTMQEL